MGKNLNDRVESKSKSSPILNEITILKLRHFCRSLISYPLNLESTFSRGQPRKAHSDAPYFR